MDGQASVMPIIESCGREVTASLQTAIVVHTTQRGTGWAWDIGKCGTAVAVAAV